MYNQKRCQHIIKNLDIIGAIAEGKTIQFRSTVDMPWNDANPYSSLELFDSYEYRVKPEPPKPDLKDGDRILVRDSKYDLWCRRYFHSWASNGVKAYPNGADAWSGEGRTPYTWKLYKLLE